MNPNKLSGLAPESVFAYFEKICSIPHGSGNTKAISDYLVSFAQEQGLRYVQDATNNVILFGDATPGYEDHPPVILQGHMDMVCEKDEDCPLDMEKDALDVTHDAEFVFARGPPWAVMTASPLRMPWRCWRTGAFPILLWKW